MRVTKFLKLTVVLKLQDFPSHVRQLWKYLPETVQDSDNVTIDHL